jgi:Ca2+-binding RTX toxin-like protein
LVIGGSGVQAATSQEKQEHNEATKEQGYSGGAASEDRCEENKADGRFTTNDLPGCPKGGLLTGTDKRDLLAGEDGEDKVRGLGGSDNLEGGAGSDILYGGPDDDYLLVGGEGNDVLYGGDGRDFLSGKDNSKDVLYGGDGNDNLDTNGGGQQDKLYCGAGRDTYAADPSDYVSSSCEDDRLAITGGTPLILLAAGALCSALMMVRYVIRSA